MIPVHRGYSAIFTVVLVAVAALASGCIDAANGTDDVAWNLTLAGDQETVVTLAEIRALPAVEGYGYSVSTVGIKYGPNTYRGVLLSDLVEMAGGAGADDLIHVSAEDGYLWVFDTAQLQGEEFFTFDENLREIPSPPLQVILAYEQDGEPLEYEEGGPLRLVVITGTPDVITEGSPWVKWVDRIEVHRR